MVCFQTAQHLWRHELEGAGKPLGGVEWANRVGRALEQIFFRTLREAKIEHLNQALRGDHDVGALEVAMNDVAAVRMAEGGGDLHSVAQHGFDRQASPAIRVFSGLPSTTSTTVYRSPLSSLTS